MEGNIFLCRDACQMRGKHLTYVLVEDIQKGGAASSHHPHLTRTPPCSPQQRAGSGSSSFPPIYDEEMAFLSPSSQCKGFVGVFELFGSPPAGCVREQIPVDVVLAPGGTKFVLLVTASQQHPGREGQSSTPKAWPGWWATQGCKKEL